MKTPVAILFCLAAAAFALPAWPHISLPLGSRWLEHLNKELLPFWSTESAFGNPFGAFPTTRCDDGTLYNRERPCPELRSNPWISPHQRHLVALSRQVYGYGVAFHLTGDRAHLNAMKAGINFIRQNAIDRVNGGLAVTQNTLDGSWGPAPQQRSSQELAYGILGLAFYYYLTRDTDVLQDILVIKNYIFTQYYSTRLGIMQMYPQSNQVANTKNKQLGAQLDQMNAFMQLLTPLLSGPLQRQWKDDLLLLCNAMLNEFYSPDDHLFFLTVGEPEDRKLTTAGTDFGHNAKALWMIRWTGLITGRADLVAFAEESARALFRQAFQDDCGCWADGFSRGGALDVNKTWWIYAELDQLAGTLALHDSALTKYLSRAYEYWFSHFIDNAHGEVWNGVDGSGTPVRHLPKQWSWKNAYHSFEHALVGYIVTQQLAGKRVTLYYAFGDTPVGFVQPYYFSGTVQAAESEIDNHGHSVQKISFGNIH